jgi:hypothetical protein
MKKSKWPDFLLTIVFRFIGGLILGGGAGLLLTYRVIWRAFARNHVSGPVILLGLCGLVGGVIAACKTPYWQTPWYKGIDNEEEGMTKAFRHQSPQSTPPNAQLDVEE